MTRIGRTALVVVLLASVNCGVDEAPENPDTKKLAAIYLEPMSRRGIPPFSTPISIRGSLPANSTVTWSGDVAVDSSGNATITEPGQYRVQAQITAPSKAMATARVTLVGIREAAVASAVLDGLGGTLTLSGGRWSDGSILTVPPGALEGATEISVFERDRPPRTMAGVSSNLVASLRLEPSGITFPAPLQLTLLPRGAALAKSCLLGSNPSHAYLLGDAPMAEEVPFAVDCNANTWTTEIPHFSVLSAGVGRYCSIAKVQDELAMTGYAEVCKLWDGSNVVADRYEDLMALYDLFDDFGSLSVDERRTLYSRSIMELIPNSYDNLTLQEHLFVDELLFDAWQTLRSYRVGQYKDHAKLQAALSILGAAGLESNISVARAYTHFADETLGRLVSGSAVQPIMKLVDLYFDQFVDAVETIDAIGWAVQFGGYLQCAGSNPWVGSADDPLANWNDTTGLCLRRPSGWLNVVPQPPGLWNADEVLDYFRAFEVLRQLMDVPPEFWTKRFAANQNLIKKAASLGLAPQTTCGNGIVEGLEKCDGSSISCAKLNGDPRYSGTASCRPNCKSFDESSCEYNANAVCPGTGKACDDEDPCTDNVCVIDCNNTPQCEYIDECYFFDGKVPTYPTRWCEGDKGRGWMEYEPVGRMYSRGKSEGDARAAEQRGPLRKRKKSYAKALAVVAAA